MSAAALIVSAVSLVLAGASATLNALTLRRIRRAS